jgi:poly(A) polymerase
MALVQAAMRSTDERIQADKPVTPAFLLAALLWPVTDRLAEQLRERGDPPMTAMHNAAQQVIASALQTLSIPRRFSMPMREIWEFQLRLQRGNSRKARELLQNRRFRAAYDFLLLREQAGEETGDVAAFWTELQTLPENQNLPMIDSGSEEAGDGPGGRPRRRRPRKRRPATS